MMKAAVFDKAVQEGRTFLTEVESKDFLKQAGIPVIETRLARTEDEAVAISQEIGFPVALKIISPEVVHKSDSGGVKLALNHGDAVKAAYQEVVRNVGQRHPGAALHGVSVQKMARPGTEVIVGTIKDSQFGPVMMFGLGGIFVEIFKDVSFRIIPLERKDALAMIKEIKGYPLLEGARGKEPARISSLVDLLQTLSQWVEENPRIKELEINPLLAYSDGVLAIDARILLEEG